MTDLRLYLAIGVPILFNLLGFTLLSTLLSARISDLREDMRARFQQVDVRFQQVDVRFEHMEKLFDAKLSRVEEVIDARLKHLEERLSAS